MRPFSALILQQNMPRASHLQPVRRIRWDKWKGQVTLGEVKRLIGSGVLLPRPFCEPFYRKSRLWARYSWYLSELTHLETISAANEEGWKARNVGGPKGYAVDLKILYARRTCRRFADSPLSAEVLCSLLERSVGYSDVVSLNGLRVIVAALNVDGLSVGLYQWVGSLEPYEVITGQIDRDEVRRLVIGQEPAGSGAVGLWLLIHVDPDRPESYEDEIIQLGRLGQRICLAATACGLGVFLTPAVTDELLTERLGVSDSLNTVAYFFAIGFACEERL